MNSGSLSRIEHFKNELLIQNLNIIVNLESEFRDILEVLYKIINYPVHEREKPFLSALFIKNGFSFPDAQIKYFSPEHIELAYKLSDSSQSFVLYNETEFLGLIIFGHKLLNEKNVLDNLADSRSVLITSFRGINKVYYDGFIFTNDGKNWECKYPLPYYIKEMKKSLPIINETIINILSFAFYILSPGQIGATIVYSFSGPVKKRSTRGLHQVALNINNQADIIALKNLLFTTDGAMILDKSGNFTDYGVHLNNSTKSKKLIKPGVFYRNQAYFSKKIFL